jgi:hypothetical protein
VSSMQNSEMPRDTGDPILLMLGKMDASHARRGCSILGQISFSGGNSLG